MTKKTILRIGFFGVFLGCLISFSACGSDSSSSAEDDGFVSSESEDDISSASQEGNNNGSSGSTKNSSGSTPYSNSSSNKEQKSETQTSNEILTEPLKIVNGTCAPNPSKIKKGELTTWEFFVTEGTVYDQVRAPFKWSFTGANTESLQGNGLSPVNIRYDKSGTATAKLNVDGNDVICDTLQVQGVPITITSCKAEAKTVKAGETIVWNVVAKSDSKITGYSWNSTYGKASGTGTKGTMKAESSMHKQNVTAVASVTNEDNTTESYTCEPVTVVDPEKVDFTFVQDADAIEVPTNEPFIAQIPNCDNPYNAGEKTKCPIVCTIAGTNGEEGTLSVEGVDCPTKSGSYLECSLQSIAGQKATVTIESEVSTASCQVKTY